jgi:hypothetical protein
MVGSNYADKKKIFAKFEYLQINRGWFPMELM